MTVVYPYNWLIQNDSGNVNVYPDLIWAEVVETSSSSSSTSSTTSSSQSEETDYIVDVSPVSIAFQVVAPNLQIQKNTTPVSLALQTVAPNLQIQLSTSPVSLALQTVAPNLRIQVSVTPVSIAFQNVAPNLQIQANVSPVNIAFQTVTLVTQLEVNTTPVNIAFIVIAPLIEGGITPEEPIIVTSVTPRIYDNVFDAFNSIGNLAASGFVLEGTELPFTSLSLSSNFLGSKYSCFTRHEHGLYQLTTVAEDLNDLIDIQDELESLFTFKTFSLLQPYTLTLLELQERSHKELEPQLLRGILGYNVVVEKTISTDYCNSITSGETLYHALHNRFLQFPDIQQFIEDLVCTGFTKEGFNGLDHIILPEVSSTLDFNTTLTKVDGYELPITFFSEDLNHLLKIKEAVENVFDYCRLIITGRPTRPSHKHLIFEWQSNEIVEIQPQLWCGKVNYNVLVESNINDY